MTDQDTCSLIDAREILGVSEKTMRNYCKANKIPFFKERNIRGVMEYRFRREDLMFFLRQRSTGKKSATADISFPAEVPEKNSQVLQENLQTLEKEVERKKQRVGTDSEILQSKLSGMPADVQDRDFQVVLLTQLIQENSFLKELLLEKEKQLRAKDSQLERSLDKIDHLSETLADIARQSLSKKIP